MTQDRAEIGNNTPSRWYSPYLCLVGLVGYGTLGYLTAQRVAEGDLTAPLLLRSGWRFWWGCIR